MYRKTVDKYKCHGKGQERGSTEMQTEIMAGLIMVPVREDGMKVVTQETWDSILERVGETVAGTLPGVQQMHGIGELDIDLDHCFFDRVKFDRLKIRDVDLSYSVFSECSFHDTDITGANFMESSFQDCRIEKNEWMSNFRGAFFHNTAIEDTEFWTCSFEKANFLRGYLKDCAVEDCNFHMTVFWKTDLENGNHFAHNGFVDTVKTALDEAEEAGHYLEAIKDILSGKKEQMGSQEQADEGKKEDGRVEETESRAGDETADRAGQKPAETPPQQDREYLDFPNLSSDRYKEIRASLKEAGVKFDYKKKDWYVTAETDREKLAGLREQILKESGKEKAQPEGQPYFKGFAQAAGQEKPTVVFGNSKEEILARLNSWNRARAENNRFETCNIGQLDEESNKYTGYHKYDMDGHDISNIYLKIPPMGKDRFQQTLSDLKDAGAKYNPAKKQWYVKYDADMDVIEKILAPEETSRSLQAAAAQKTENTDSLEAMGYRHVGDMPEYTLKGIFYSVELPGQGRTVMISADRVGLPGEDAVDLINRLEDAILEEAANAPETVLEGQTSQAVQLEIPEEPEYRFSVSRAPMENRCTIWFSDGRDSIRLDGQNFGVDFSLMENERVSDFVKGYLEHDGLSVPKLPSYVQGDRIDCYLQNGEDGSFSHVTGEITEIWTHDSGRKTVYEIREDDGQYLSTDSRQVF